MTGRRDDDYDDNDDDECAKALGLHPSSAVPSAANDAARRPVVTLARSSPPRPEAPKHIDLNPAGLVAPAFARPWWDIPPAVFHCHVG
ncbi:uncharacterized protein ColSpa_00985 [Colletotrichum spaethianum]|uniref:Uncharacterized protein n=1 Tax=Colletotrichum spaethianum TaxID=700344 RepID=A0AA37P6W6_9PEZI|nr:uncharacterized protein ColSpa_00985 [Colletotrichum spaethianum]GKT40804.1 hypothetical protein ColSpa_00985 [Colletotrichum spaethianum]